MIRLSKDIYKENQQNKEKFKSNFLKKTNPILNYEDTSSQTQNKILSPTNTRFSNRRNMTSDELNNKNNNMQTQKPQAKGIFNYENNFKTNYETQYSKNKTEFENKKSNRRHNAKSIDFLCSHNNITGNENRVVEDTTFKNNKKLFETVYYRKSLQNLYRGEADKIENHNPEKQEIIHPLKTKKHFVYNIKFFKKFICLYICL